MFQIKVKIKWYDIDDVNEYPVFTFTALNNRNIYVDKNRVCNCGRHFISGIYIGIIESLKEAGLVPEDFRIMCCECYEENRNSS